MSTILLVEDDARFASALDRHLREERFEVVSTVDSLEALRLLESNRRVDLLLTDIKMPEGQPHGIALSMMARVRRPKLPVIFMSGYPGLIKEGRIAEPVFEKPFNLGVLVDAIRVQLAARPR
jgi:CheY-like chemotaxis protein